MRKAHVSLLVLAVSLTVSSCAQRHKVATVIRDEYGVPHIFSDSEEAAAYAFGYVQAEDRIEQLMKWYRMAEGRLSEVFGEALLDRDFEQRVWRHAEVAKAKYDQVPGRLRRILEAFVAGINDYVREHPERTPEWAIEVKPWHPLALGRAFIWGWPLGDAKGDLRRGLRRAESTLPGMGSNQWAVAPKKSALGCAIALIDPHLSWDEAGHWYEARIHAGRWQACGMVVVGTPFIGLGHTESVSWAATTGGPDCGDCYVEVLDDPASPTRYRYDGEWRPLEIDTVRIPVARQDRVDTVKRVVYRTHHGPIYERRGDRGYALAIPYEESVALVEQLYRMNRARSLKEFQQAMAMCEFMPQNIMAADVDGNIWYVRTGKVPVRSPDYDWRYPVPGDTSATEWKGIHKQEDLVQILNPDPGYMQNCNISPGTMMHEDAPKADDYLPYIYNDRQDRTNPRGSRAVEVLSQTKKLTREGAFELAFDTKVYGIGKWQQLVEKAFKRVQDDFRDLHSHVEEIVAWNGRLDREETAPLLYYRWREELGDLNELFQRYAEEGETPSRTESRKAMLALRRAVNLLRSTFGKVDVKWGDYLRLVRGERSWPLDGGSFSHGMSVLRAVWGEKSEEGSWLRARGGQSCPMLVFLTRPIESYSVLPWGVSDNPESPHFDDQASLFSMRRMKPTWFEPDSAWAHAESTTEFVYPPRR